MAIELNPNASSPANEASVAPTPASATRATYRSTSPTVSEPAITESQSNNAPPGSLQANVTFRRDPNGQIYYVLTDAQSGKEIREVPPAEIRKVSEGIQDFLKQEEAKANPRIDSKA